MAEQVSSYNGNMYISVSRYLKVFLNPKFKVKERFSSVRMVALLTVTRLKSACCCQHLTDIAQLRDGTDSSNCRVWYGHLHDLIGKLS